MWVDTRETACLVCVLFIILWFFGFSTNCVWLFQVALNGLEVMTFLVERMREDFRPYLSSVVPVVTDRLGKHTTHSPSMCLLSCNKYIVKYFGMHVESERKVFWWQLHRSTYHIYFYFCCVQIVFKDHWQIMRKFFHFVSCKNLHYNMFSRKCSHPIKRILHHSQQIN